jgi:signal transduction histidine kinase
MIIVGDARDPFTALDQSFLLALGQQVGAALENAELYRSLRGRTEDLERLSVRMIRQHEEERRRLSLELHDETAQVFSAVKLQLGMLKEKLPAAHTARMERIIALVDAGMSSIRSVTEALRPSLLDDLGLIPALRALVTDFGARSGLSTRFTAPDSLPGLEKDAELALFRAVQEGLANVARHAKAKSVAVTLKDEGDHVLLELVDDGHGPVNLDQAGNGAGHMGLAGMRERFASLGGRVELEAGSEGGARLMIALPREAPSP